MTERLLTCLLLIPTLLPAQRRVDPKNTYVRLICVVSQTGTGTAADPKRPLYAPAPVTAANPTLPAIIGYTHQLSDDGKYSLVEFVARDMSAFQTILNDKTIKVFIKGRDKKADIEAELKKYKKDFDLDKFGLVMP